VSAEQFDVGRPELVDTTADALAIRQSWIDGIAVLAVTGELDLVTAPRLNAVVVDVIAKAPAVLIIDLTDVGFLASAGMTALVVASDDVSEATRFAVVADGPATSRPMKLVGLDAVFTIYPSLDAALDELR
jgi:anti-sigma B factor antagonist